MKSISKNTLEKLLAAILVLYAFGPIAGLESNIQPFNRVRINDTSFRNYLSDARKINGDTTVTYLASLWTYPGARLGAAIHNYGLPKD